MTTPTDKARFGRSTQNGVVQAGLSRNRVSQVELLICILVGFVGVLEVSVVAALATDHAHIEGESQPQTEAGWPHAGNGKDKKPKDANWINCDIL